MNRNLTLNESQSNLEVIEKLPLQQSRRPTRLGTDAAALRTNDRWLLRHDSRRSDGRPLLELEH